MSGKVVTRVRQVKDVFENHRTFLSLSATVLSCVAAWLGYQARVSHQKRLEAQLSSINEDLRRDFDEYEKIKVVQDASRTDIKSIAGFAVASLIMGYTLGRFHGRRSAIRKLEMTLKAEADKLESVADSGKKGSGRVFTKLFGATDPQQQ